MLETAYYEPTTKEYKTMVKNHFSQIEKPLTDGQVLILTHLDVFETGRVQGHEPASLADFILENWEGIFNKENIQNILNS